MISSSWTPTCRPRTPSLWTPLRQVAAASPTSRPCNLTAPRTASHSRAGTAPLHRLHRDRPRLRPPFPLARGASEGSQRPQTLPDGLRPFTTFAQVRDSPPDSPGYPQTPFPCLGVKGSRVQIQPSRHGRAVRRPFHRTGGVASRSFDRTLTAGFCGIPRQLVFNKCGARHSAAVRAMNSRRWTCRWLAAPSGTAGVTGAWQRDPHHRTKGYARG